MPVKTVKMQNNVALVSDQDNTGWISEDDEYDYSSSQYLDVLASIRLLKSKFQGVPFIAKSHLYCNILVNEGIDIVADQSEVDIGLEQLRRKGALTFICMPGNEDVAMVELSDYINMVDLMLEKERSMAASVKSGQQLIMALQWYKENIVKKESGPCFWVDMSTKYVVICDSRCGLCGIKIIMC